MASIHRFAILTGSVLAIACATARVPKGSTEIVNNYGYHPVDPLPVHAKIDENELQNQSSEMILSALPDETMRLAVGEITASGALSFGPAKAGYAGRSYVVVLDYIKFETKLHQIDVTKDGDKITDIAVQAYQSNWQGGVSGSSTKSGGLSSGGAAAKGQNGNAAGETAAKGSGQLGVPFYVGVGLRMTATITVNEGSVDLGSFLAIGAAAQAKKVNGTLVVQTLGVSGSSISPFLPMPSEISTSTIQNAIVALGAIKAKLYDKDTIVSPRVVGIYNNLGGDDLRLVNKFITGALQSEPEIKLIARKGADGVRTASSASTAPGVSLTDAASSAR